MKRILLAMILALLAVAPAWADQALAQKKNCMTCHTVDKKVVGPAYKDVAKKYAGQNVTDKLVTKVRKGGAGAWGVIPMPAMPQVSESDARQLVAWILAMK